MSSSIRFRKIAWRKYDELIIDSELNEMTSRVAREDASRQSNTGRNSACAGICKIFSYSLEATWRSRHKEFMSSLTTSTRLECLVSGLDELSATTAERIARGFFRLHADAARKKSSRLAGKSSHFNSSGALLQSKSDARKNFARKKVYPHVLVSYTYFKTPYKLDTTSTYSTCSCRIVGLHKPATSTTIRP